ncbi:MAG: shikimate kinase [Eggerthellaceae bacterium]|nr:shikimate kinase [Eggerthellaceae bacterium]
MAGSDNALRRNGGASHGKGSARGVRGSSARNGGGQRSGAVQRGKSTDKGGGQHGGKRKPPVPCELVRPVFFVGFMGAGKTSVSRRLARLCGISSIDMDSYIERREGRRIRDIFAEDGEGFFRDLETQVLREMTQGDPALVSCGGGVVLRPENRAILRESGFVVFLKVGADEAKSRISDPSTRPLLGDAEAARKTNAERLPLYEEAADATVDTSGKGVTALAYQVRSILKKEGILWQRK